MELNYKEIILKISNLLTVSSYIKGTLLFTLFTISNNRNDTVLMIGLAFVGIAVLVNIIVLVVSLVIIITTTQKELKQNFWIAIGLQFTNIPIAIAYFYYVVNDQNYLY